MGRGKAIPLTDTKIDSAPVGRLWDSRQPGLLIVTSPKRRQSFKVRFDLNGKQRFKVIGDYPMLTLEEARKTAHEIRAKAKIGAKPVLKGELTVRQVVNEFLRNPRYPLSKRSTIYQGQWYKRYERAFESHIKYLDPGQIPQSILIDIVEDAIDREALAEAQALKSWVGTYYRNLAHHRSYKGPNRVLNPIKDEVFTSYMAPDKDSLTEEQVRDFYLENPVYNAVAQLLLFTGQRVGRVIQMKWSDIENDVWVVGIKGEMKTKSTAHHLPWLDEYAELVEPFRDNGSEYVFTVRGDKHISQTAIYKAINTINSAWHPHILRHTFISHLSRISGTYDAALIAHHSSAKELNNVTHRVYLHDQQLPKKRKALQAYADWIFQLRCKYDPYPEAEDYSIQQGKERGNFDSPPEPLDLVLESLSPEQRAVIEPLLPKSRGMGKAEQARAFQRASIEADFDYLIENHGMTTTDALTQLSTKYHLPMSVLSDMIQLPPAVNSIEQGEDVLPK